MAIIKPGALSVFLLILSMLTAPTGFAQDKGNVVTPGSYKYLVRAQEAIGKNRYQEALSAMNTLKRKSSLNPHEKALMWQTYGYIHAGQDKYKDAIKAFAMSLSFNALPVPTALQMEFTLGQLYLIDGQSRRAVATLTSWIKKVERPTSTALQTLANAHVQAKQYKKALPYAQRALAATKKPVESQFQLLLSVFFELKRYSDVAKTLERLVSRFPKREYWLQLSAAYASLKREGDALATLELAHLQGFLIKHSDLQNLALNYLHHGIPIKAVRVLEKGIAAGKVRREQRSLRTVADGYLRAREHEKAIPYLEQAAKLSKNGNLHVQLAHVYMQSTKWSKARTAIKAALAKGKLTNTGGAHLLLGIINFRSKKMDAARKAFRQAANFNSTKRSAEQWLNIVKSRTS